MGSLEIDRGRDLVHPPPTRRPASTCTRPWTSPRSRWLAFRHAAWMGRLLHQEKTEAGYRSGLDDFLLGRRQAS